MSHDNRQVYRDNHGLQLPVDVPPGTYLIQVVVYDWREGAIHHLNYPGDESGGNVARLIEIAVR